MAARSLLRDVNMVAVASFGKNTWSLTKRGLSKNKANTIKENNSMESSKQIGYNRAEKKTIVENKENRKYYFKSCKDYSFVLNQTQNPSFCIRVEFSSLIITLRNQHGRSVFV